MRRTEYKHAADEGKRPQPYVLGCGIIFQDGTDQPAHHLDHRPHDAAIDAAKGFGWLHLLANDEPRPALRLIADEENHHSLDQLRQEAACLRSAQPTAFCVEFGEAALKGGTHVGDMAADEGGEMVCRGDEETFLAAKIIGDRLEIDARRVGELSSRCAIEAVAPEDVDRGVE